MFCKNCGESLNELDSVCKKCGSTAGYGNSFCMKCGSKLLSEALFCAICGSSVKSDSANNADSTYDSDPKPSFGQCFTNPVNVHRFSLDIPCRCYEK